MTKTCRKCNETKQLDQFSKHSGTADGLDNRCKDCVNKMKRRLRGKKQTITYDVYILDEDNYDWQAGKPSGTIMLRTNKKYGTQSWQVVISLGNGRKQSKSFTVSKFPSIEDARKTAYNWRRVRSLELGLTRNRIKKIDDDTIEVELSKGYTMITDMKFQELCQKYTLCVTKSGREGAQYYTGISINNEIKFFHSYITGNSMTDHINRNPLDNRLENLRRCTYKENNNNRGDSKGVHMGVRFVSDRKGGAWQARIKQDGKEYTKSFSVKKHGDEAHSLAIEYREILKQRFNCRNGTNTCDEPQYARIVFLED